MYIQKILFAVTLIYAGATQSIALEKVEKNHFERQIEDLLVSLRQVTGVPSFSVAIAHKGQIVTSVAVGYANQEKEQAARSEHIYRLASVSKVIGATMLADLVVQGKLDPDLPIGQYYPELHKNYHNITVRQLMAHTSGMPHYQAIDYDLYSSHYNSASDAVQTLKGRNLLAKPGAYYKYSSHAFTLAGAIYEKITGIRLSKSLPKYINDLTGRHSPIIEDIRKLHPRSSMLYERYTDGYKREKFGEKSYSVFGAGLSATAPDLALFGSALLTKTKQSQELRSLLFSPSVTSDGKIIQAGRYEVGFGWRIGKDDFGRRIYHHAGATPGARSVIVLYPDHDLTVSFLSNASWVSSIERTATALADLYIMGANETALHSGQYKATYGGFSYEGQIDCTGKPCSMHDANSPFSKWLNRFNQVGKTVSHWPMYVYNSTEGKRLIKVTKIGFIPMGYAPDEKSFTAKIRRSKTLEIRFLKIPK